MQPARPLMAPAVDCLTSVRMADTVIDPGDT
jgi:hypothetical protein